MSQALLPRLYERDIDVLLQEELIFNDLFKKMLCESMGIAGQMKVDRCRLSVVDQSGETDVLANFSTGTQHGVILLENKIDAGFQPRQPERYRERAALLASASDVDCAFCVLVSPRGYARTGNEELRHFDAVISYEDVAACIASEATPRSRHRAALLLRAVEQARSAYVLAPVAEVSNIWDRIYRIASAEFPDLRMKQPSQKGGQSNWVIFKADLPPRITIDWKITKATVDLSFWKGAVHRPTATVDLSPLRAGASVQLLGDTLAIQVPLGSPPAEWTEMTDDQLRDGMTVGLELLRFYRANRSKFA